MLRAYAAVGEALLAQCNAAIDSLGAMAGACPWRYDATAEKIPHFDLALAERVAATCPDAQRMGPDFAARLLACHASKVGAEFAGAGWLAQAGQCHRTVQLAVATGRLNAAALAPREDWPALHADYGHDG